MNALHFQEGFINERFEVFFSSRQLFLLSPGAFPFGSVDAAGLQHQRTLLREGQLSVPANTNLLLGRSQPDVVWLCQGKELTNSYSMETIRKLKNTAVSEIAAKYTL